MNLETITKEEAEILANEASQMLSSRIFKMTEEGLKKKWLDDLAVLAGDAAECQKVAMMVSDFEQLKAEIESLTWVKVDAAN